MSGDIYNCDKCGESIHTSCDCGLPDNTAMEKENLELRALVSDAIYLDSKVFHIVERNYLLISWFEKRKEFLLKAEKYKQGREG